MIDRTGETTGRKMEEIEWAPRRKVEGTEGTPGQTTRKPRRQQNRKQR